MLSHQRNNRIITGVERKGVLSIELLLLLPIVIILLVAFYELTRLETVKQQLAVASAQGARVAAQGGLEPDIKAAVLKSLPRNVLQQAGIEARAGTHTGDPVVVEVSIPAKKVVPDLLRFIGFSLHGRTLKRQTILRRE